MLANDQLSTAIELIACFTYHASAQAGVAQLVEQRIRNAKVGGSTPLSGTTYLRLYLSPLRFPAVILCVRSARRCDAAFSSKKKPYPAVVCG